MTTELARALIAYVNAKVDYEIAAHASDDTPDRSELREAERKLEEAIKEARTWPSR